VPIDTSADLVLLATAHRGFRDYDFSRLKVPLVDTRNSVRPAFRPAAYWRA
jgi:UDP-N-acetyl-D-mannosaminuronate dehydrogenase